MGGYTSQPLNIPADAMAIAQAPQNAMAEYARIGALKQQTALMQQQQAAEQQRMQQQGAMFPGQLTGQQQTLQQQQLQLKQQQLDLQDRQGFSQALLDNYGKPSQPGTPPSKGASAPPSTSPADAPRTVVRNPATGAPEFSDVMVLQQPSAPGQSGTAPAPAQSSTPAASAPTSETPAPTNSGDRLSSLLDRVQDPKYGISPQGQMGFLKQYTEMRKDVAGADKATIDAHSAANKEISQGLQSVLEAPPEDQAAQYSLAVNALRRDPTMAKYAQSLPPQYPGPAQLQILNHSLMLEKDVIDDVKQKNEGPGQIAHSQVEQQNVIPPGGGLSPATGQKVLQDIAVQTNPQIQQGKVNVATAEGIARANIEAQIARGSNASLAMVPPHLVAPATAAATKAGEDYAQAQSVSQRLQAIMDDAKKGNVVSYQLLPEEGALQVVTAQGIHRINMAEIQNYGGGSYLQALEGHIGKALTGKSIPDSVLNDMGDMQRIMAEGSQTKYQNTLSTINQYYGSKFQPVQMAPMARNQVQSGGGTAQQFSHTSASGKFGWDGTKWVPIGK